MLLAGFEKVIEEPFVVALPHLEQTCVYVSFPLAPAALQLIAVITPDQAAGGVAAIWAYNSSRVKVSIRQSYVTGNYASSLSVCERGA